MSTTHTSSHFLQRLNTLRSLASRYSWDYVCRLYLDDALRLLLHSPVLRRRLTPSLQDFYDAANGVHTSSRELLRKWFVDSDEWLGQLEREFKLERAEIAARVASAELTYLETTAVTDDSSLLLYALVRIFRPRVMVETGVANGYSTFFILKAMESNGLGDLHSVDVSGDVGRLIAISERTRWHLHVLETHAVQQEFEGLVRRLPPIDLFMHDSNHRYEWQDLEFNTVLPRMAPDGIVASDDIDFSFAFLDFCERLKLKPIISVSARKVFGLVELDRGLRRNQTLATDDNIKARQSAEVSDVNREEQLA
jgi:predicted O-methyltransferase YrrM